MLSFPSGKSKGYTRVPEVGINIYEKTKVSLSIIADSSLPPEDTVSADAFLLDYLVNLSFSFIALIDSYL